MIRILLSLFLITTVGLTPAIVSAWEVYTSTQNTYRAPRHIVSKTERDFVSALSKKAADIKKIKDSATRTRYQKRFTGALAETKQLFSEVDLGAKYRGSKKTTLPSKTEIDAERAAYDAFFVEVSSVAAGKLSAPITQSERENVESGVVSLQKLVLMPTRQLVEDYLSKDVKDTGNLSTTWKTPSSSGQVTLSKYTSLSSLLMGRSEVDVTLTSEIHTFPSSSEDTWTKKHDVTGSLDGRITMIGEVVYVTLRDASVAMTGDLTDSDRDELATMQKQITSLKGKTVKMDLGDLSSQREIRDILTSDEFAGQVKKVFDILETQSLLTPTTRSIDGFYLAPKLSTFQALANAFGEKVSSSDVSQLSEITGGLGALTYVTASVPTVRLSVVESNVRMTATASTQSVVKMIRARDGQFTLDSTWMFDKSFTLTGSAGSVGEKAVFSVDRDSATGTTKASLVYTGKNSFIPSFSLTADGRLQVKDTDLTVRLNAYQIVRITQTMQGANANYSVLVTFSPAYMDTTEKAPTMPEYDFRLTGQYVRELGTFQITEPVGAIDAKTLPGFDK